MNPKVSIIMGIYNCQDTLKQSIDSILDQTYENWELIMCDDCSSDSTYNIAYSYANKFPEKIKLIKNSNNLTLAPTLNRCLELSTGDYIARQDGDDLSIKDRLEKQLNFLMENNEYDIVGTSMISFNENGDIGIRGVNKEVPDKFELLKSVPFCHATILAKKEVFKELEGYRVTKYTTRCEDLDLWFRFFEKGFKGYNLREALYKVRDDSSSYKRRTFRNYLNIFVVSCLGYKRLNMPISKYIFLIKPLITPFIPDKLIKYYHKKKLYN
ncbi:glycosyltransferase [Clostridium perfringens]|nr:glycosyltransferase family 2 protein [Clostridium perfringens]